MAGFGCGGAQLDDRGSPTCRAATEAFCGVEVAERADAGVCEPRVFDHEAL
ncbi:hypothetical protein [Nocardia amikacinitolerans]|uniref:hypothetical protein n=1 Tax=Nocardia amikacinitolerans TaxID=756689 RepID=UPI000A8AB09A|nr:hypothetical protein [Nocardia amikacinitolerans]